ncbi:TIR domain-containing protein [Paraburkholderia sp. DHOC27]|uniref:TIR domain-containing protein n=1 Tax=Paraburkholderia sp. DHOC27 TaxID=2303330 RepID=UPI000E3E44B1|nr:TIR domain-containing protein [Paraburkholderia sp. DHOC27]RFU49069.1 TIR domain-containing protein [Paraburkholderia sp. DHOC27]
MENSSPAEKRYDVSLSFAGEDRPYVELVAGHLRMRGIRVFYDAFEDVELWGKDLIERFAQIYERESELVVVFISEAYKQKAWTTHERRHALSAAIRSRREYILPVRFDATHLDGLSSSVGYIDATKTPASALAERIIRKLASLGIATAQSQENIDSSNTVTIDARSFMDDPAALYELPVSRFKNLSSFLNEIYFLIKTKVTPFRYGESWILRDESAGMVIKNSRMIYGNTWDREEPDTRPLSQAGINAGARLTVESVSHAN